MALQDAIPRSLGFRLTWSSGPLHEEKVWLTHGFTKLVIVAATVYIAQDSFPLTQYINLEMFTGHHP